MEPVLYTRCFFGINVTYTICLAHVDCLGDSATALLSSKLHYCSDNRWRYGRQQIKNFENCRYENICIKLCFNFNKELFSDGYITK